MSNTLKSCPFCGGEAEITFNGTTKYGGYIVAKCIICSASAGATYYRGDEIEIPLEETVGGYRAATIWNKRVGDEQ